MSSRVLAQLDPGSSPTNGSLLMRGFQTPRYLGSFRLEDLRVMVPSPDELPERVEERIDEGPAHVFAPVRPHVSLYRLPTRLPFRRRRRPPRHSHSSPTRHQLPHAATHRHGSVLEGLPLPENLLEPTLSQGALVEASPKMEETPAGKATMQIALPILQGFG